jgi:hypothetical protein
MKINGNRSGGVKPQTLIRTSGWFFIRRQKSQDKKQDGEIS